MSVDFSSPTAPLLDGDYGWSVSRTRVIPLEPEVRFPRAVVSSGVPLDVVELSSAARALLRAANSVAVALELQRRILNIGI